MNFGLVDKGCFMTRSLTATVTFESENPMPKAKSPARTSIDHRLGLGAMPYWSTGDKIWVKDTNGYFRQSGEGTFNSDMSHGIFTLSGTFDNGCTVNYTGTNGTAGDRQGDHRYYTDPNSSQ